ncbi:MAG: hypothetical protein K6E29_09380 [Cyanobacteria bacterium RUI128]|nr:hypothetical protein [Cyanobacteria bacterium RUI128]
MEQYRLRFKPTGNIFVLPKDVAVDILRNDRGNYEILDKDFVDEEPTIKTEEKSIFNKVVQEEEKEEVKEQPKPKKKAKKK